MSHKVAHLEAGMDADSLNDLVPENVPWGVLPAGDIDDDDSDGLRRADDRGEGWEEGLGMGEQE